VQPFRTLPRIRLLCTWRGWKKYQEIYCKCCVWLRAFSFTLWLAVIAHICRTNQIYNTKTSDFICCKIPLMGTNWRRNDCFLSTANKKKRNPYF